MFCQVLFDLVICSILKKIIPALSYEFLATNSVIAMAKKRSRRIEEWMEKSEMGYKLCVCAGGTIRSFPSLHLFIAAYSFCKHIKNVLGNRNLKPYYTEGARKRISIYI